MDIRPEPELKRELKAWGSEIRTELQEVFTEPIHGLADRIEQFTSEQPEKVNEIAHWRPLDRVPYGVHDLPPHLFEHSGSAPFIPATDTELEVFMDSFWSYNLKRHASIPGFHAHATFPDYRSNLTNNLKRRREEGIQIDPSEWQEYQHGYQAQLERGFFTLGHNAAVMNIPRILQIAEVRRTFDFATGRQQNYLLASMDSPHAIGLYLRVPEGEYGAEFAERLTRAASFMYDFINRDTQFHTDLWEQFNNHTEAVSVHTERAVLNRHLYSPEESMIVTVQEGVGSILGGVNLATAQKIDGYEDGDLALAKVIEDNIPDKMARLFPLGVAGAASTFGVYFPGIFSDTKGRLAFNASMLESLSGIKERATGVLHKEWTNYHQQLALVGGSDAEQPQPPTRTGLNCPSAGPHKTETGILPGGIARLSEALLKVFNCIEADDAKPRRRLPWLPSEVILGIENKR